MISSEIFEIISLTSLFLDWFLGNCFGNSLEVSFCEFFRIYFENFFGNLFVNCFGTSLKTLSSSKFLLNFVHKIARKLNPKLYRQRTRNFLGISSITHSAISLEISQIIFLRFKKFIVGMAKGN